MANRITDTLSEPSTDMTDAAAGSHHEPTATVTPRRRAAANSPARKTAGQTAGGTTAKAASKVPPLKSRAKATPAAVKAAAVKVIPAGIVKKVQAVTTDLAVAPPEVPARSLRQHAVPAALFGAGLAWYLLQTQVARSAEARLLGQAKRAATAVGGALAGVGESAGEAYTHAADSSREAIGTAAESVGNAAGSAAEAVQHGAVALAGYAKTGVTTAGTAIRAGAVAAGETTAAGYRRGQKAVAESWDNHPLVVGATLLAAGVTAGMFLPAPRQSGALFSRVSADLSRKLSNKAGDLIEKGRVAVGLAVPPAPAPAAARRQRPRTRTA